MKAEKYLHTHFDSKYIKSEVEEYAKLYHSEQIEAKIKKLEEIKPHAGAVTHHGSFRTGLEAAIKTLKA